MKSDCAFLETTPGSSRRTGTRTNAGTTCLSKGATVAWSLHAGETLRVRGRTGLLWVTMDGDAKDYVLGTGHQACFSRPGLVVIEGMSAENEVELLA